MFCLDFVEWSETSSCVGCVKWYETMYRWDSVVLSKYSIHLDSIKWSEILFYSDFVEWSRIMFYSDFVEWSGIVLYSDSHVGFIEWQAPCSTGVLLSGLGTLLRLDSIEWSEIVFSSIPFLQFDSMELV